MRGALCGRHAVQQLLCGAESSLDGLLVALEVGAVALQLGESAVGLGPVLPQDALGLAQPVQAVGVAGADPVQGGGLRQEGVRVGGQQQGDGGAHTAGAVLRPGERTETVAEPVDDGLLAGRLVLYVVDPVAEVADAFGGGVVLVGVPLGLRVEPVDAGGGVVQRAVARFRAHGRGGERRDRSRRRGERGDADGWPGSECRAGVTC